MAVEMLVGLNVIDDAAYQTYREQMAPILAEYGGGFRCDFCVAKVLKAPTQAPINRLFTIFFASQQALDDFFSNPAYQVVKSQYFEGAVADTSILATYNLDDVS